MTSEKRKYIWLVKKETYMTSEKREIYMASEEGALTTICLSA